MSRYQIYLMGHPESLGYRKGANIFICSAIIVTKCDMGNKVKLHTNASCGFSGCYVDGQVNIENRTENIAWKTIIAILVQALETWTKNGVIIGKVWCICLCPIFVHLHFLDLSILESLRVHSELKKMSWWRFLEQKSKLLLHFLVACMFANVCSIVFCSVFKARDTRCLLLTGRKAISW